MFRVAIPLLGGAFMMWAVQAPGRLKEKGALCVLRLPPGISQVSTSFTTSRILERFQVGMRPGSRRERLSISIEGEQGLVCRVSADARRFACGLNVAPGRYTATLRQEIGCRGGLVVVSDKEVAGVTGWQVLSRVWLGLLVASGVWTLAARRGRDPRQRVVSVFLFHSLLLGCVLIFFYLLFHEGGHSLGALMFGCFDWASSDFWGIHGTPHAGGKGISSLEPWQRAVIAGAGPVLPTLAGWMAFVGWRSRLGRNLRRTRPMLDLYLSASVVILLFPFVAVPGYLLGIISDGDWLGFIQNVPGPLWLVKCAAWAMVGVNGFLLWRILPGLYHAWKTQVARMQTDAAAILPGPPTPPA